MSDDDSVPSENSIHATRIAPGEAAQALCALLEKLGLSGNEARALVALLRVSSVSAVELAEMADVPRTSAYPILRGLSKKGLVHEIPGRYALWASVGRETVFERLYQAQQERLRRARGTIEEAKEILATAFADDQAVPIPDVQVLRSAARVKDAFEELVTHASSELVALSRPPYSWSPGETNRPLLDALARGVTVRAVYQLAEVADDSGPYSNQIEVYVAAGVQARVTDSLSLKLAVADRTRGLLALTGPRADETGYPTHLLIDHEGLAAILADGFERQWDDAHAFPAVATGTTAWQAVPEERRR